MKCKVGAIAALTEALIIKGNRFSFLAKSVWTVFSVLFLHSRVS